MRRRRMHLAQQTGDHKILAQSLTSLGLSRSKCVGTCRKRIGTLAQSLQISRREGYNDALAPTPAYPQCASLLAGAFPRAIHFAQESVTVAP